jgi:F-type H+-transporting ATPase subunit epsilon
MNLEILTPEKKLYSGEVYGVQMPGVTGSFEVLEKHAPMISALKAGRLKVLKDKQHHFAYFDIQGGFVEVLNNKVTVLVEGATAID